MRLEKAQVGGATFGKLMKKYEVYKPQIEAGLTPLGPVSNPLPNYLARRASGRCSKMRSNPPELWPEP